MRNRSRPGVRSLSLGQSKGRIHQSKMTERLREVAELSLVFRVVLFGKQSEIAPCRAALSNSPYEAGQRFDTHRLDLLTLV